MVALLAAILVGQYLRKIFFFCKKKFFWNQLRNIFHLKKKIPRLPGRPEIRICQENSIDGAPTWWWFWWWLLALKLVRILLFNCRLKCKLKKKIAPVCPANCWPSLPNFFYNSISVYKNFTIHIPRSIIHFYL